MTMTSKYAGTCRTCQQRFAAGTTIEWAKEVGARHATCGAAPIRPLSPQRGGSGVSRRSGRWTGCACGSREDEYGDLLDARNNCASCEYDA